MRVPTRHPVVARLILAGWLCALSVPMLCVYVAYSRTPETRAQGTGEEAAWGTDDPIGDLMRAPRPSSLVAPKAPTRKPRARTASSRGRRIADLYPQLRERPRFIWPVVGRVNSRYGPRGKGFHHGIDIGCWFGDAIAAAARGRVAWAGEAPVYGKAVIVDHAHGFRSLYAHLSAVAVTAGQRVTPMTALGLCGSSGHSTGPHLHFEIRKASMAWDPLWLLPPAPER